MYRNTLYICISSSQWEGSLKKIKIHFAVTLDVFKYVFIQFVFTNRRKSLLFYFQAVYTVNIVQNVNL
jgi:hypothetical protein